MTEEDTDTEVEDTDPEEVTPADAHTQAVVDGQSAQGPVADTTVARVPVAEAAQVVVIPAAAVAAAADPDSRNSSREQHHRKGQGVTPWPF